MNTKVKRDCIIVLLLAAALILTACAGKRPQGDGVDWADLARSAAVPEFGKDACGQTLTWSYELGRWEVADGREVVAENRTIVRIACEEEDTDATVTDR
jgi:predicted small secreted protein